MLTVPALADPDYKRLDLLQNQLIAVESSLEKAQRAYDSWVNSETYMALYPKLRNTSMLTGKETWLKELDVIKKASIVVGKPVDFSQATLTTNTRLSGWHDILIPEIKLLILEMQTEIKSIY